jgi:integrase
VYLQYVPNGFQEFDFQGVRLTHMALTDYLKLRGRTWYVRVQIPPQLWTAAGGKREFIKTLRTADINEANRLKHAHVAAFQRRIKSLERQKPDPLADLYEKAIAWRDARERYKGQAIIHDEEGKPLWTYDDEFISQISEEAQQFLDTHGEQAATSFFKIAKGEGTPLRDLIDTWLAEQAGTITEQTSAQHRTVVTAFLEWAGQGLLVEDVDRRKAGGFVSHLLVPATGLKRKTVQRYVSSLSSLWRWLVARGVADGNPWRGHDIGRKSKRGEAPQGGQWTDAGLVKLLTGTYTPQYTAILHDLIRLALVTGARLDELCSLQATDALQREDGCWIKIGEGKTDAAVREVPIHVSAAHVIERRRNNASGFLFEGLVAGGPDKKRSWNVSKAFGHYTRRLDLGDERRNFHALRKTFTEAMEAAEIPESTTALIVGHKRASMTYGHYSTGTRVQLREAIVKLSYPPAVMRLIRGTGKRKRAQEPRHTPERGRQS